MYNNRHVYRVLSHTVHMQRKNKYNMDETISRRVVLRAILVYLVFLIIKTTEKKHEEKKEKIRVFKD